MEEHNVSNIPMLYDAILKQSEEIGFEMSSDKAVGALLKVLVASKPGGNFLELGTGTGLALAWIAEGMDDKATLTSIDNDPKAIAIAKKYFEEDPRIAIHCEDAAKWIAGYQGKAFDLIFADTWAGKYTHLDDVLMRIKPGGFYVVDDMHKQPNWPEGHEEKVKALYNTLEHMSTMQLVRLDWATGLVVAVKI
ncbi:MAG: class I SAM-dependent methyltransferase [Bacteroidota bacterium]